jgi:YfiR/HmsC-like
MLLAAAVVAAALGTAVSARAGGAQVETAEVKAALLFNFAKFVDWAPSDRPLLICTYATDAFAQIVRRVVSGRTISDRPIVVRGLSRGDEASTCDVVYVGASTAQDLSGVRRRPTLTVGEGLAFIREGGIISLYAEGDRLRFAVSAANARFAGLVISSKLLALAAR